MDGWIARLASGTFGPVLTYAEALAHPHTLARGMALTDGEGSAHLNTPVRFAREPSTPDLRIAGLGQDNDTVLAPRT